MIADAGAARVLVLSGLPRAFSAGVAVEDHVPDPPAIEAMLSAMRAVLEALVSTPAVTVASVSGACLGGGAEIAAACDFV
ncbi:MAG: enoyl-CoA hydratase-related protein, partial [Pseudomonadota bacterium]